MVGSSVVRRLSKSESNFNIISSTRDDADLFSYEDTRNIILKNTPDVIINAAAKVGGIHANNTKRTEFILENLKINMNILEACIDLNEIKIINLGSSCIYPLNSKNPINEEDFMEGKLEPTNSPYAIAKIAAIEIGKSLNEQYGHTVVNLMPTNLYGPNDNFSREDSHVIPGLIRRMSDAKKESKKEFNIWGSGKPLREFLYVDDLAESIEFVIESNVESGLYNIGSGDEITIFDLAKKIQSLLDYKGNLSFDSSKPDGNPRKLLDSKKINDLGWKSRTSLDKGLEKTIDWFIKNI
tara:strand:- start:9918 stop:10805 length:888 start_codon:yes stop_codon:yes gene_type:complete